MEDKERVNDLFGLSEEKKEETVSESPKKKESRIKNENVKAVLDWVKVIVIALVAAILLNSFVIINSIVPSGSMENTIMTGTRMIGWRLAYTFGNTPERGDIIIFRYPDDPSIIYVKRVIGLPGDTVVIENGVTYINGEALEEPYIYRDYDTSANENFGPYEVPEDSYFVMGDHRNNSKDSRYWSTTNFVEKDKILAKAIFSYWPLSEISLLK